MPMPIDVLPVQKSLIDLTAFPKNSFNSVLYGYKLKQVLDDVLLVEYSDETSDGSMIKRNGLFVPINADTKAWRIGKVILAGRDVRTAQAGDYVIFPNNLGMPVANIDVEGYGSLKSGIFLNEQRIFGIASQMENNDESVASILKNTPAE